jgi:hypothetical protein
MDLIEVSNDPFSLRTVLLTLPDGESPCHFDLSNLNELSELNVAFHAMRFPVELFVKLLSSAANARSPLHSRRVAALPVSLRVQNHRSLLTQQ